MRRPILRRALDVIDAHAHAFPDTIAAHAMRTMCGQGLRCEIRNFHDGTVAGLLASMDRAGIARAFLCGVATKPTQVESITDWVSRTAGPRIVPFASLHPDYPEPEREIERAVDSFSEIAQATEELSAGGKQILESIASLNDASQGLRESGAAIAKAQGRLLELQERAKEGSSRVLAEARSVAESATGLSSAAEAVSEVAERGKRDAAELHESMSRIV